MHYRPTRTGEREDASKRISSALEKRGIKSVRERAEWKAPWPGLLCLSGDRSGARIFKSSTSLSTAHYQSLNTGAVSGGQAPWGGPAEAAARVPQTECSHHSSLETRGCGDGEERRGEQGAEVEWREREEALTMKTKKGMTFTKSISNQALIIWYLDSKSNWSLFYYK